tara:strand:- start:170 stop:343 length:174 start_codon:yes stop_codon:yes gene_type:complete
MKLHKLMKHSYIYELSRTVVVLHAIQNFGKNHVIFASCADLAGVKKKFLDYVTDVTV